MVFRVTKHSPCIQWKVLWHDTRMRKKSNHQHFFFFWGGGVLVCLFWFFVSRTWPALCGWIQIPICCLKCCVGLGLFNSYMLLDMLRGYLDWSAGSMDNKEWLRTKYLWTFVLFLCMFVKTMVTGAKWKEVKRYNNWKGNPIFAASSFLWKQKNKPNGESLK